LLAPKWKDTKALSYLAKGLEMSPQGLKKWAAAGAVLKAGIFEEEADQDISFYYELSLWPEELWGRVADIAVVGGLDAAGLRAIRKFREALEGTDVRWCPVCDSVSGAVALGNRQVWPDGKYNGL